MFTNIVIGVDGRQGGLDAIALAVRLGATHASLTLAHVERHDGPWRGSDAGDVAGLREQAQLMLAKTRDQAAPGAQLRQVSAPSVSAGLHAAAEAIGADLLVIGSCHRGRLGRVLLGDDTCATLGHAPCSVAIAPAGYDRLGGELHEVGVGYSGTGESEHALSVARTIAAEHGARLSAYQALRLPAYAYTSAGALVLPALESTVEDAHERLRALGGVEPHAAYGTAVEELTFYSRSLDLLVIGSSDHGPVGRLVHGRTARALSRSAGCPLLVLARAGEDSDLAPVDLRLSRNGSVPACGSVAAGADIP